MPPRRRAAEAAAEQPSAIQRTDDETGEPQDLGTARAQAAQRVARSRAAHFAHFSAEGDAPATGGEAHVGGTDARHLGPWNSAVELAEARGAALERRQEKLREAAGAAAAEEDWRPARDPSLGPRCDGAVPLLSDLALDQVVSNIEDVETLAGLPYILKTRIARQVCARRAMSAHAVELLTGDQPDELVVADCTLLEPAQLEAALLRVAGPRLEVVDLGLCGRGMTDATARRLAAAGPFLALRTLRLAGAYRLGDEGLLALLRACPALRTLGLPESSRLTGQALERWAEEGPGLEELDIAEDRGMDGRLLARTLPRLGPLTSVVLSGCDIPVAELLGEAGVLPTLRALGLERCAGVSDAALASLAAAHPDLESLDLGDCAALTDAGVAALAQHCRALRVLSLRRCQRVGEEGLEAVAALGTLRTLCVAGVPAAGPGLAAALAARGGKALETLDVSWCRGLRDGSLGRLVEACPGLRRLEVWGCSQLTPAFLHGHGGHDLELVGRGEALRPVLTI
ncbi:hypothetical protein ACKKBG_A27680 [Auxenochlorella protothecoides x Auxenochlorella symbiontica]